MYEKLKSKVFPQIILLEQNSTKKIRTLLSPFPEAVKYKLKYTQRWIRSTNHFDIGILYLILGRTSGVVGLWYSIFIRLTLDANYPNAYEFEDPQAYNVTITLHAFIRIFFSIRPILIGGFGNIIVPRQLGTPDMAFPRLNNRSF